MFFRYQATLCDALFAPSRPFKPFSWIIIPLLRKMVKMSLLVRQKGISMFQASTYKFFPNHGHTLSKHCHKAHASSGIWYVLLFQVGSQTVLFRFTVNCSGKGVHTVLLPVEACALPLTLYLDFPLLLLKL